MHTQMMKSCWFWLSPTCLSAEWHFQQIRWRQWCRISSDSDISSNLEAIEISAAAAVPKANVGHKKLAAIASSSLNNFGDDNDEELSSDQDRSSDLEVIESSDAPAVPSAKAGHQSPSLNATWAYDVAAS